MFIKVALVNLHLFIGSNTLFATLLPCMLHPPFNDKIYKLVIIRMNCRTVNLTLEKMPIHELISNDGELSLDGVLSSEYKRIDSLKSHWWSATSKSIFTLWDGTFRPSFGLHVNFSSGWVLGDEGNLIQSRMRSILRGSTEGFVAHCSLNNQQLTDKSLVNQFCPVMLDKGNIGGRIFGKIEKKTDKSLMIRALMEFFSLGKDAQERLKQELKHIEISSLSQDFLEIGLDITKFLARVSTVFAVRLDKNEQRTLVEIVRSNSSNWKDLLKNCGNHTTTITCNDSSKDFCAGNSVTKHFGITVLFAICLPGLIQGLSNLIFYKVRF